MGFKVFGYSWLTVALVAVIAWFIYSRFVASRR